MNSSTQSAGLAFMLAAYQGIAKSIGDRERSGALNSLLASAIKLKMAFDADDSPRLAQLAMNTCVGVFRPSDEEFYSMACISGGTFARMWEKARGVKPFKAVLAGIPGEIQSNNRVAPGLAVLLDGNDSDELMPRYQGRQVWWVTSVNWDQGIINLSRYRLEPDGKYPFNRPGVPAKRLKLSRNEWEDRMREMAGQSVPLELAV